MSRPQDWESRLAASATPLSRLICECLDQVRSDRIIRAGLAIGLPIDQGLERNRTQEPFVLLLHLMPNVVNDVGGAQPVRVRMWLGVDPVQRG